VLAGGDGYGAEGVVGDLDIDGAAIDRRAPTGAGDLAQHEQTGGAGAGAEADDVWL
jgi:hypothetical protein